MMETYYNDDWRLIAFSYDANLSWDISGVGEIHDCEFPWSINYLDNDPL